MATIFHHTWTYQALAHDVLDLSLNRLVVEENAGKTPTGGARTKTRPCELNDSDQLWAQHKGSPFPRVVEAIEEEMEQYHNFEKGIKNMKSSMNDENDTGFSVDTARLTNTVNSLPQYSKLKQLIDMHTTIATSTLIYLIVIKKFYSLAIFQL